MFERFIVNASPLVFLGNAGRLDLLRELSGGRVAAPSSVLEEVTASAHSDRASEAVRNATWIESLDPVAIPASVALWNLDVGEAQVVATGLMSRASRLVVDDLVGRKCALANGLDVIGTIGVVIGAYRKGLVTNPVHIFAEMRACGMWISEAVLKRALELAGLSS